MTDRQFQRARSPEQREARRQAILGVAGELLAEMPVSEISLRELARRVGLSKTNVVRYFETREAVFFALLNRTIGEWLDGLDLPAGPPAEVMEALARSLAGQPRMCDLWSALGTELERNITAGAVRDFKLVNGELLQALAGRLRERIPALTEESARELTSYTVLLIAGLWPFANPSPGVAEAVRDPRLAGSRVDFAERLGRALVVAVTGLLTLGSAAPGRS
ncbi:TetR/AcrR family transcriptional regulator [Actinoplanes sp. NPDC000266]